MRRRETRPATDGAESEGSSTDDAVHASALHTALTWRVLLLSLILIPLNAWWIVEIEFVRYSDNATTQAIFFNSVSLLLALVGLNALIVKTRRLRPFAPQELAAIFVVVTVGSNLAGHDQLQILFSTMTYVFRHDTPETQWGSKIIPYLPVHLVVSDHEAISALYQGNSTLYRWDHIRPWLLPLANWSLFAMLLVWVMLCLTALFRKQWDAERLSYPIAEIPVEIIMRPKVLATNPLLWVGVSIGALGQVQNMLHALYPSLPGIMIGVQYFPLIGYPWNAADAIPVCTYPFAYGLCFLLPTQLGFSCWFFFLLSRLELIGAAMLGYQEAGKFPYVQQQGVGACIGLFTIVVWSARAHIASVWREATSWRAARSSADENEPMSPRAIMTGLFVGGAGLIGFLVAAGMRVQTAAIFLGLVFVVVVVVARLRAELGLPTYELYQVGAEQVMQRCWGTSAWNRRELGVMTLLFWLTRTHRQFPMSNQVDAVRLGRRTGTWMPSMTAVILGASALGIVSAFWALLHSTYQVGFESAKLAGPAMPMFGAEPWQKMTTWIGSPERPDPGSMGAYAFGICFTVFLAAMRTRFVWWPFHPAGYLVSGSFGLFRLWLPLFVSWLAKVFILRYGGLRGYRRSLPFFLGLILGEFSAGFLRTCLDLLFGLRFPPNSGIGGL